MGSNSTQLKTDSLLEKVSITKSTSNWIEGIMTACKSNHRYRNLHYFERDIDTISKALHVILSGGRVNICIKNKGDRIYDDLEKLFSAAWEDSNTSNKYRRTSCSATMMP